jgi:hypothetical protein
MTAITLHHSDPIMEQHAQVSRSSEDERRPLLPQNDEQALHIPIKKRRINKSAIIAILILIVAAGLISIVGFVLPKMAQRYVEETIQVDVSDVKVLRLTETGADAQADLTMSLEASRSTLGSFQRRIADKLVALAGTVRLRDIAVRGYLLHDGQHHVLDAKPEDFALKLGGDTPSRTIIKTHVRLLHTKPISDLASAILNKQIKKVSGRVHVSTTIHKLLTMRRSVKKTLHYTLPDALDGDLPPFNISQLDVKDGKSKGLTGSALLKVLLQSPVDLDVPSISVDVLIDGCERDKILLATGHNAPLHLDTKAKSIQVRAMGKVEHLPKEAMVMCQETRRSPLDRLMQQYLAGNETRVYVRGSAPMPGDSSWLQRIASRVMLPIDLPGSQTDQFARDIELADVKFNIGGFFRQEKPKISGNIKATIDIPEGIDVKVDINSVKLLADLIFKGRKFATMASPDWSPASSTFVETTELHVQAQLRDVPVTITDNDVFSSVVSALLGGNVLMDVAGTVDVKVRTGLGELQPRGLPLVAKGIEIGGFAGGLPSTLKAAVQNLGVVGTTPESLELAAQVSIQ